MTKSKVKNPLIIILILALIAVGAWFFVQKTASDKAEEEVQKFLVKNNLQDNLTYAKLEASPTGTATLKEVKFLDDEGDVVLLADELNLNKYKEDTDFLEVDIDIKKLMDANGDLQEGLNKAFAHSDKPVPQYLDSASHFKLDGAADEAIFKSSVIIPDYIELESVLTTDSPTALLQMMRSIDENPDMENFDPELLESLGQVKLKELSVEARDIGGVKSLLYALDGAQSSDAYTSLSAEEREEKLQKRVAAARQECPESDAQFHMVEDIDNACDILYDFLENKRSTVKIKLSLTKPMHIDELMVLFFMGGQQIEQILNEYKPRVVIE